MNYDLVDLKNDLSVHEPAVPRVDLDRLFSPNFSKVDTLGIDFENARNERLRLACQKVNDLESADDRLRLLQKWILIGYAFDRLSDHVEEVLQNEANI